MKTANSISIVFVALVFLLQPDFCEAKNRGQAKETIKKPHNRKMVNRQNNNRPSRFGAGLKYGHFTGFSNQVFTAYRSNFFDDQVDSLIIDANGHFFIHDGFWLKHVILFNGIYSSLSMAKSSSAGNIGFEYKSFEIGPSYRLYFSRFSWANFFIGQGFVTSVMFNMKYESPTGSYEFPDENDSTLDALVEIGAEFLEFNGIKAELCYRGGFNDPKTSLPNYFGIGIVGRI